LCLTIIFTTRRICGGLFYAPMLNLTKITTICLSLTSFTLWSGISSGSYENNRYTEFKSGQDTLQVEARMSGAGADKKSFTEWKPYATMTLDQLSSAASLQNDIKLDKFGARLDKKGIVTGFFHTQKLADRWYVIDPEGNAFICKAVNSITTTKDQFHDPASAQKFDNIQQWMTEAIKMITKNGFNVVGSWSNVDAVLDYNQTARKPIAYTVMLNWMSGYGKERGGTYVQPGHTGYPNNTIFAFDPGFKKYCEKQAKTLIRYKRDPNFFGYFSDNEMPINTKNLEGYLSLPDKNDTGYIAAKKWLDDGHIKETEISDQNKVDFLAYVADTYYSTILGAIRSTDPNHMYIGSRLYSSEKNVPEFFKAASKYIDIFSINHYHVWSPKPADVDKWTAWSGKPFMITEYYAKGMDAPGLANTSGAGWVVKTQADRGLFYQNFSLNLLQSKNCVGWHWFKYIDNDPNDKNADPSNSDSNKGMVDIRFEPYKPLVEKMKPLNDKVYQLIDYYDR
jgi:hypothetical protein